jgi:hypothetical protein
MTARLLPTVLTALLLTGCSARAVRPEASSTDAWWSALQSLCGNAYQGRMVVGTDPSDAAFGDQRMVMHVRSCTPQQVRVPFWVGEDPSRTWVFTRPDGGLRLKHDHRHADGTAHDVTWYGGDARGDGTARAQHFAADEHTSRLLPRSATNVWTVEIEPGVVFAYVLRREAEGRHFRVEFDLARPIAPPHHPKEGP